MPTNRNIQTAGQLAAENAELRGRLEALERELERRSAELAHLSSEAATLRAIYDSAPQRIGVVELVDDGLRFVTINRQFATELAHIPADALPLGAQELAERAGFEATNVPIWVEHYWQAWRENQAVHFETKEQWYGEERVIAATVAPIAGSGTPYPRCCFIVEDVTERQRAEEERQALHRKLQETQRLESIGVMAGTVAHDFNNILTSVMGRAELALLDLPSGSEARTAVEGIVTGARRAAELTDRMLTYAGHRHTPVQPLLLNDLIREMADLISVSLSKSCIVEQQLDDSLPPVLGDAAQIRQVLMNLLMNASEAIGSGSGEIVVRTAAETLGREDLDALVFGADLPPGPYARLSVVDSGMGMDPATLARIFDPFFTTKHSGRGLGLAAVQGIVRAHHGALRVVSAPGQGAEFTLWLPARGAGLLQRAAGPAMADIVEAPLQRGTLLVIDDEEGVREVTARLLQREGYEVRTAGDGATGLALLSTGMADIAAVLLDLTMPHMGGDAVARAIRSVRPDTPIVLMSGYSAEDVAHGYADVGAVAVLQKPFTRDTLRATLSRALALGRTKSREQRAENREQRTEN